MGLVGGGGAGPLGLVRRCWEGRVTGLKEERTVLPSVCVPCVLAAAGWAASSSNSSSSSSSSAVDGAVQKEVLQVVSVYSERLTSRVMPTSSTDDTSRSSREPAWNLRLRAAPASAAAAAASPSRVLSLTELDL